MLGDVGREPGRVGDDLGRHEVKAAAAGQRREDRGVAKVGADRRDRAEAESVGPEAVDHVLGVVGEVAVGDRDALGDARRPGGEEEVRRCRQ